MDTVTIRSEIQKALSHEATTHELAALLLRRINSLHINIVIREQAKRDQSLLTFVCRFINRTPELLDALLTITRYSSQEDLCESLAYTCEDFFIHPPALLSGRRGLNGVMAKSYFCHRLIEELNDYCAVATSSPLLPLDITCSNLIIHQLIGEPFANFLDELVNDAAVELQDTAVSYLTRSQQDNRHLTSKLEVLCRQHGLLDRELSPGFCITSQYFNCTIH